MAFIIPEFGKKVGKRINNGLSVFTGEMLALLLAVQWVEENKPLRTIICSDSSSSLISLDNNHSESRPDILLEVLQTIFRINMMGLVISFVWVPAHYGVPGNEEADKIAKEATRRSQVDLNIKFSRGEMKDTIKKKMRERWQKRWEEERTGRWFYSIQRKTGDMRRTERNRREETIISRLRFGHTGLNSTLFIIGKHQTGRCCYCEVKETIEHVLLYCQNYIEERRQLIYNLGRNQTKLDIKDLLQRNSGSKSYSALFQFLKRTRVYDRI